MRELTANLVLSALLGVLALPAAAAPANTGGQSRLTYDVYLGGLEMVQADFNLGLSRERYDLRMQFRPSSWMGSLLPWSMKAHSRGRIGRRMLHPERAGGENTWRGRRRFVALGYRGDRTVVTGAHPEPARRGRLKVPEALRRGTLDLAAAVLQVAMTARDGAACRGTVPVYDGRRRYNLHLTPAGSGRIARSRYSAYEGTALRCRVTMERLYGFRKSRSFPRLSEDQPLLVWFGRPFEAIPPMPVRFEIDSPYGNVRAHLSLARSDVGGRARSIAAKP